MKSLAMLYAGFDFDLNIGLFWTPSMAIGAVLIALAIAAAVMLLKRSKLKSVRFQRAACNYVRPGSFKLAAKRDVFLFANTTRIPRSQNTGSSGGRRR